MSRSIQILLPSEILVKKRVYFRGFINKSEQPEIVIYITECSTNSAILEAARNKGSFIGYYHLTTSNSRYNMKSENYVILEPQHGHTQLSPEIKKLVIDGNRISTTECCIIMLYDYQIVKHSETICDSNDLFKLQTLICNGVQTYGLNYKSALSIPYWLTSSMLAQHLIKYINLILWLIHAIRRDKKISIKVGNVVLAILVDVIMGYFILQLLTPDKTVLSSNLMHILEKMVNLLDSLLKWLMGSPAGLKLNNAFNKMLGNYFSYHIQLWWLFLDVSGEKLDTILHLYNYVGYLGFTLQAAIISDMICVATFHSYCIYVYAARLFNIQVSGLFALLRLFVGRKYNPLRGGIDSCEYTNQELFVGTVAFTILLLLLPTTTMYYIVFTLFRLLSLVVQYSLAKIIHVTQTLPLYALALWLARSPKIAGNVLIEVVNNKDSSPLVLKVKLHNVSLKTLINKFGIPVEPPKHFEWSNVLSNIIVGKQLVT